MIIGSYESSLGDKRRTAVPRKFLGELGEEFIVAKWYENCLVLVSNEFWNKVIDRLTGGTKVLELGVRDIDRFIIGSAFQVTPDEQGRIIIPEILAQYAHLERDLIFVGLGDRVEIWNKNDWDLKSVEVAKTTKEFIESLSERNKK
ncbi:MAG TPA: hypothetical protein VG895_02780 [Patescibacteria group bacterium]|nr:hypothetical protein [Patescibacteria group bacterium]